MCNSHENLVLLEQKAIDNSPLLEGQQTTLYRSGTMRLKYLDQDKMDLTETVKVLEQAMSQPRLWNMMAL